MRTGTLPSGVQRWLFRAPIWLYRANLGWLFGDRFLLLMHRGRNSGKRRYVLVEVVYHDQADDTYYIASGWGEKANWFRNIQHDPQVMIQVGRQRSQRLASCLPPDEAASIFFKYAQAHPTAMRALSGFMLGTPVPPTAEGAQQLADSVPLVALRIDTRLADHI